MTVKGVTCNECVLLSSWTNVEQILALKTSLLPSIQKCAPSFGVSGMIRFVANSQPLQSVAARLQHGPTAVSISRRQHTTMLRRTGRLASQTHARHTQRNAYRRPYDDDVTATTTNRSAGQKSDYPRTPRDSHLEHRLLQRCGTNVSFISNHMPCHSLRTNKTRGGTNPPMPTSDFCDWPKAV